MYLLPQALPAYGGTRPAGCIVYNSSKVDIPPEPVNPKFIGAFEFFWLSSPASILPGRFRAATSVASVTSPERSARENRGLVIIVRYAAFQIRVFSYGERTRQSAACTRRSFPPRSPQLTHARSTTSVFRTFRQTTTHSNGCTPPFPGIPTPFSARDRRSNRVGAQRCSRPIRGILAPRAAAEGLPAAASANREVSECAGFEAQSYLA